MSYKLDFSNDADKCIAKCKKSNPIAYKKIFELLAEIQKHPRTGTGHPEPLIKGSSIRYSRRISGKDRMIYDIFDDIVLVKLFVVTRVVEFGQVNDYYAIFRLYGGIEGVREIIKQIRTVLDPKDEAFVRTVFNLKKKI